MDKTKSSFFAGLMTGVLLACVLGAFVVKPREKGGISGKVVLKLGHGLDESHPVHQGMLFMKKRLEELTAGKATINVYSGGVLGGEVDCLEQVQKGELAMTKVSTGAIEAFIPEMKVFSLPYAFRNAEHFWNTMHSPVGEKILQLGVALNFKGLCYYDSGDRNFYSTKVAIRSVDDMKGLKVRVMNSRTAMDMIKAMGGSPCPINWGELYTALSQGVVDAAENNPPSFITSKHSEVCKYFTLSGHQRIPDMLIVSTKVWDGLPMDIRVAMQTAADESEIFQRKLWQEKTEECLKEAQAAGVEIITPDIESFRNACAPILKMEEYADVRALYAEIQEVK